MGSFYDNVLVTAGVDRVVAALEAAGAAGLALGIGPELTVVYPKGQADFRRSLSQELDASLMWAVMHDSDVLDICIWQSGRHVHDYCNCPEYFALEYRDVDGVQYAVLDDRGGEERLVLPGVAGAVVAPFEPFAVGDIDETALLAALENRPLDPDNGDDEDGYIFANALHWDAMTALGLPASALTTGHRYLMQDAEPGEDYSRYVPFGGALRPDPYRPAGMDRAAVEFFLKASGERRMLAVLRGGPRDGEQEMVEFTAMFDGIASEDGGSYRPGSGPDEDPGVFYHRPDVPPSDEGWPEELIAGL